MASDPFVPIPLFAFPLFHTMVGGHEAHKEGLLRHILAHQQAHPGIRRSNRNAWHSGEAFQKARDPHMDWVLEHVTQFARGALAPYYDKWARAELRLGSYWANVLGKGGSNAPHHHFPQHWSGTYYVSVGRVGTDAEDVQGMIEFLNPTPWQGVWNRGGNFALAPKDGMIVLFPSSLVHLVHATATDEPRISIAYNFNVVPRAS